MTVRPDHAGRRRRALAALADTDAQAIVVSDRVNVAYLSGFTGSHGSLLLTRGEALLVTDGRYTEQAAQQCPGVAVKKDRAPDAAALREGLAAGADRVAVEADHVSWAGYTRLADAVGADRIRASSGLVEGLRRAKDTYEVACIERACSVTEQALAAVLPWIEPGRSEWDIAVRLERLMVDLGADAAGFASIVATGRNSAEPHHRPGGDLVGAGDLLKIDCGARTDGYHADITRMFLVGAEPSPRQRQLHAAVAAAAAKGRGLVAAGRPVRDVDRAARDELGRWAPLFSHGLGHGVGLQIHESPLVAARSADTMGLADVLTIEPGVYEPGFGGVRIEDTLLVTDTGSRCLTTMPRDLVRLA